jgi:hypothetical protein
MYGFILKIVNTHSGWDIIAIWLSSSEYNAATPSGHPLGIKEFPVIVLS